MESNKKNESQDQVAQGEDTPEMKAIFNRGAKQGALLTALGAIYAGLGIYAKVKDKLDAAKSEAEGLKAKLEAGEAELKARKEEEAGPQGDPLAAYEHAEEQKNRAQGNFELKASELRYHFIREEMRAQKIAALRKAALAGKDLSRPETWETEEKEGSGDRSKIFTNGRTR